MPVNWPIAEYWNLITSALAKSNVNFSSAPLLAQKMVNAGFTNVTEQVLHIPIGPWARNKWLKMVGVYWRTVLYDGASAIALRPLTRGHGWTMQEGAYSIFEKFILSKRSSCSMIQGAIIWRIAGWLCKLYSGSLASGSQESIPRWQCSLVYAAILSTRAKTFRWNTRE